MVGRTRPGPVLITGCSSGIGRAAALSLHQAGFTVYATARRTDALTGLSDRGLRTLALDVTDEESMTTAVAAVEADAGAVGVLINNAGYGLYGPVEQLPMPEIRRQFETNFFGLVRLTQLVLPGMRRRGRGRILNVSSMGGRITLPGGAFYHASKYAVEAFSDALRMEVAQFGIDVVLIEPGPVKTPWNDVAAGSLSTAPAAAGDAYREYKAAVGASFGRAQAGLFGRLGSTPEDIAKVITQAITARRPRARYLINPVAKSLVAMNRVLPARAYDSMLRRQYGLPRWASPASASKRRLPRAAPGWREWCRGNAHPAEPGRPRRQRWCCCTVLGGRGACGARPWAACQAGGMSSPRTCRDSAGPKGHSRSRARCRRYATRSRCRPRRCICADCRWAG